MAEDKKSATPSISLPKGGGAIKGIGETFQPDLFSGTGNFTVPIAASPGRAGFGPQLSLQYSTGNGNGPFGRLVWDGNSLSQGSPEKPRRDCLVIPMKTFSSYPAQKIWLYLIINCLQYNPPVML